MLSFSSFADAHLHLAQCAEFSCGSVLESVVPALPFSVSYCACTCAHDQDEFLRQESLVLKIEKSAKTEAEKINIINSFGMHPQLPLVENADFMETLLRRRRIRAVGETGFDLFTKEYKANVARQEEAWRISIELATSYRVPIVVHLRKAMDRIFRDAKPLSKLPAVIFHSFTGSVQDARSILRRGINAYFSFGNPLIFGDKSAIACVKELDADRLLLETDAPFQTCRGETETKIDGIARVYETAFAMRNDALVLRGEEPLDAAAFSAQIFANFKRAYEI